MEQPNLEYILEISGGIPAFKDKLVAIIQAEFPDELQAYLDFRDAQDWNSAAASVHKIKHKISILGLLDGHALASQHEQRIKQADLELDAQFVQILEQMAAFIKTL